jgi:hypothetical protein
MKSSKTVMIRNFDETTHAAAKIAAMRLGVSLNKFMLDAIRGHVLRAAMKDRAVAAAIEGDGDGKKQKQ